MRRLLRSSMFSRLLTGALLVAAAVGGTACEPEHPRGASAVPQTSRLGMSQDGRTLYVALADHDRVRAVDADTGEVHAEIEVPGYPHRLTVLKDGRIAVTSRHAGTLTLVDVERRRVEAVVEVGPDPFGVVESDGSLWVAVGADAELARIALDEPSRVAERIALEDGAPRGLAVTGEGKLLVSHASAGRLSVVDVDRRALRGAIDMKLPSRGFFVPTQLDALTVAPDSAEVAVPHVECNNDPAQFGAGGTDLAGAAAQYYVEGPTGFPAVVPAVSRADAAYEVLLSDDASTTEVSSGLVAEPEGPANPVINPLNRTLLGDALVNGPTAVAFAQDGELELVLMRNSGNVLVRRSHVEVGQSSIVAVVEVGAGAEAIQVSRDGARAYVYNAFDDEIVAFDVPEVARKQSRYGDASGRGSGVMFAQRAEPLARVPVAERFVVAEPVLPENVRTGRKLFHAVDERLTRMGAVACASCHPGGAGDGVTWQFAEGPRQSPPLWGGITDTAPFHWDSLVPTMADISTVTIQGRMGGLGLSSDEMDDIGAFLDTIPAPAPSRVLDAAAVERGRAVFFAAETRCVECHGGADLSDGQMHDVGTGVGVSARETRADFATPNLHGLAQSGPYLHDGSARTLDDLVRDLVRTDRMGTGSHLTDADAADLVAFLKTL